MSKFNPEPKRFAPLLERLVIGMVVTVLLMLAVKFVEHRSVGHRIETTMFEVLQLPLPKAKKPLPIVVVNMSDIPRDMGQVTSRAALRRTLQAVVDQGPLAVGIDLDFSPGQDWWIDDDDPQFFEFCLKLKQERNVPIFLGVYRTTGEEPDTWLGSKDFKELAAALTLNVDTKRLPLWIQAKGSSEKLPTLGAALAKTYGPTQLNPASWLSRVVEVTRDNRPGIERQAEDRMVFGESLVNYTKLEEIQNSALREANPASIAGSRDLLKGKIVLIGDATRFEDPFNIAGRERSIAGVYVLACVVYTLAVEPLYELNIPMRLCLDLGISIFLMLIVELLRARYVKKRPGSRFFEARNKAIWIVVIVVSLFGLLIVRLTNIMWFDIPFIAVALLLHPKIEHRVDRVWHKLKPKKQHAR
jgi:CHASE2 domain-containing sensor protein